MDEKIFGPLTLKQFIYAALFFGVAYLVAVNFERQVSIPVVIVIAGIAFAVIRNCPTVVIDRNYLKVKRYKCRDLAEFQRWVNLRIAMVQSQIKFREAKGLPQDEKLLQYLGMFEEALRNLK